jgi:GH43 family beta-xylosidase
VLFRNPVHTGYLADPFVLAAQGRWWVFGTGQGDELVGMVSDDLLAWQPLESLLEDDEDVLAELPTRWAPEVSARDGRYLLYFSAGQADAGHRVFVAESSTPAGPYTRVRPVEGLDEVFAIDAHVLAAPDGHYLFYATDRLDTQRVGTAVVVRRLVAPDRVEAAWYPVAMPTADWQLFARGRAIHGGTYDWHTCEGPFVVRRGERWWCLYSGGSWQTDGYGMSASWAEHPLGPWHDLGEQGPTVIRTVPGRALGPGHASVVTDLAGQDWLAYHAWDEARTARRMCLDRLVWDDGTPVCLGPTVDDQPAPVTRPEREPGGLGPQVHAESATIADGSGRRITYYSWQGGPLPRQHVTVGVDGPQP